MRLRIAGDERRTACGNTSREAAACTRSPSRNGSCDAANPEKLSHDEDHQSGGAGVDVFAELVSFPDLIAHAGLTIELVLIHEEVRRFDGTRGWRRKGWVVEEWRLLDVVGRLVLRSLPTTAMTTVVARRSAARIRTTTRAFAPQ